MPKVACGNSRHAHQSDFTYSDTLAANSAAGPIGGLPGRPASKLVLDNRRHKLGRPIELAVVAAGAFAGIKRSFIRAGVFSLRVWNAARKAYVLGRRLG